MCNNMNVFNTTELYTQKMVKMVNFRLCVFYHNKKILKKYGISGSSRDGIQCFFFKINFMLFISFYFWLYWVFVAVHRLSLVAASRGYSLFLCAGFSLRWLLLLWSMGSRCVGFSSCGTWVSVVVAHGLCSCGLWALELRLSSCGAWA